MAEPQSYTFNYKEVVTALVKQQNIHEGIWGLMLQFGIGAGNVQGGPEKDNILLAAIVPVLKIGIQIFDAPNPLTVNAAEVNPIDKEAEEKELIRKIRFEKKESK